MQSTDSKEDLYELSSIDSEALSYLISKKSTKKYNLKS